MKIEGLLEKPQFDKPEYYLTSGERTKVTPAIQEFADSVSGVTDEEIALNLLKSIHKNFMTPGQIKRKMEEVTKSEKEAQKLLNLFKFKRSADKILKSGYLTGCCDYSTLYTALARARGIPAMQVITVLDQDGLQNPDSNSVGHYFTAVYIRNKEGKNGEWRIIDTARVVRNDENVCPLKIEDRNIVNQDGDQFYAIAYTRDYSDIVVKEQDTERKINNVKNMVRIQTDAFNKSDKDDIRFYRNSKNKLK